MNLGTYTTTDTQIICVLSTARTVETIAGGQLQNARLRREPARKPLSDRHPEAVEYHSSQARQNPWRSPLGSYGSIHRYYTGSTVSFANFHCTSIHNYSALLYISFANRHCCSRNLLYIYKLSTVRIWAPCKYKHLFLLLISKIGISDYYTVYRNIGRVASTWKSVGGKGSKHKF